MTTVVAWLWQGLAIAALTTLALGRMRRLNAATRYAIWWLALLAVVLLPIVRIVTTRPPAPVLPVPDEPVASALVVLPALSGWVISCAVAIWLATAIAGAVRIVSGLSWLVRLKRHSQLFDAGREGRLPMWTSVRHSGRRPELRVADMSCGACALGLRRPVILISQRLLNALDDEELDQIVMHEHAHLARYDDWSRLAQAIITIVAGLHPAVRFISRQIDLEREAACDDRVVSRTGAPSRYAACLADAAAISVGSFESAVIPGAIESPSTLRARVGRLLEPQRDRAPGLTRAVGFGGVALFAGIVVATKALTPVVVFLESRPAPAVAAVAPPSPERVQRPAARARLHASPPRTENQGRVTSPQTASVSKLSPQPVTDRKPMPSIAREKTSIVLSAPSPGLEGRAGEAAEAAPLLEGNPLEHSYTALAPPAVSGLPNTPVTPVVTNNDAPWKRVADAGTAIGGGAKRSGVAIGDFFTRAGKAIARTF
jgi:beta-lactamase regulating signal transducer with metallopeptidase domain